MPDHESETNLSRLAGVIEEELRVRLALKDDLSDPAEREAVAEVIADAVLDVFVVRARAEARTSRADRSRREPYPGQSSQN